MILKAVGRSNSTKAVGTYLDMTNDYHSLLMPVLFLLIGHACVMFNSDWQDRLC